MSTIAGRLEQVYPDTNSGWGTAVLPLHERLVGKLRPMLTLLFGATALLLLISCVNVVSLLFAQSTARQGELAVRVALGATAPKLLRQFLAECLLLTLAGGVWGCLSPTGAGVSSLPPIRALPCISTGLCSHAVQLDRVGRGTTQGGPSASDGPATGPTGTASDVTVIP